MNGRSFFEGTITFLISLAALTMALRNLKKVPTTTISLLFVAFGLAVFTIALYVYSVIVAYELEAGAGFYFSLISGVGLVLTGVWCFSTGKGIGKGRMQNMLFVYLLGKEMVGERAGLVAMEFRNSN